MGSGLRLFSSRCPANPLESQGHAAPVKWLHPTRILTGGPVRDSLPGKAEIKCPREKPRKALSWSGRGSRFLKNREHPWKVYPLKHILGKRNFQTPSEKEPPRKLDSSVMRKK